MCAKLFAHYWQECGRTAEGQKGDAYAAFTSYGSNCQEQLDRKVFTCSDSSEVIDESVSVKKTLQTLPTRNATIILPISESAASI